jgi:glycosyltransferase involved in cell wall biosynthesis
MKKQNKLKILEICPYSAGGCGVWARVKQEAIELLKKDKDVIVFSSHFEKGTDKIMPVQENISGIKIRRFPAKKLGGESFMKWNFEKEALDYAPDIIIAHNYRHLHTTKALKLAERLKKQGHNVKIFLVTHAPFVEGNITRSRIAIIVVKLYDAVIGPRTLKRFDKVLPISHWEIPHLEKLGLSKNKIVYIPNGIPQEFFTLKKQATEENKVLFLGRIAPKKKIETIIQAIPFVKNKNIKFEIVGPAEKEYKNYLDDLIKRLNVEDRIVFSQPVYNLKEKIAKLDSAKVYILASRVEGMPQGMIEAMARGKIVIGSDSIAIRDLIINNKNGYLFEFDNPKALAEKINLALKRDNSKIKSNALNFVKKFSWPTIIKQIEALF